MVRNKFRRIAVSVSLVGLLFGVFGMVKQYCDFQVLSSSVGIKNILGFYFFLGSILYCLAGLFFFVTGVFNERRKNYLLLISSLFVSLLIAEVILRLSNINATHKERSNSLYYSPFMRKYGDTLFTIPDIAPKFLETNEFKYPRLKNKEGFRDADFYTNTDTTKYLIQTYGDSFTEGDGAPMDSSYPAQLRKMLLHAYGNKFILQNFGMCGNDPAFCLKQFEHIGLKHHPNLIVITYCSADFEYDYFLRGGLNRFKGKYVEGYKSPWWEILYAYSYVFRAIEIKFLGLEHSYNFMTEKQKRERMKNLPSLWNETFQQLKHIAATNGTKVMLVKFPGITEVKNKKYDCNFSFFENSVFADSLFTNIDLLQYYSDSAHWNANNVDSFYWKYDMHNNAVGYSIMAKGVYSGLKTQYKEIFK